MKDDRTLWVLGEGERIEFRMVAGRGRFLLGFACGILAAPAVYAIGFHLARAWFSSPW